MEKINLQDQVQCKKYSVKSKLSYALGDIYGGGAFLLINLLFLNYLTDVVKLSPIYGGLIMMLGKIVDAVTDPLMGYISDRTKSKHGRRRIYFLYGILPVFASFTLLWYSFGVESQVGLFFYYLLMFCFFSISFTMVMIPYNSLLPEMVQDYKERTSYTTIRLCFSVGSSILAGVLPMMIIRSVGDIKIGYLFMAVFFAVIFALPWIFVFKGTWESNNEIEVSDNNVFVEFIQVFKNRAFKVHSGIFLSSQAAVDFLTGLFIYYLTWVAKIPNQYSLVLGILLGTQLLMMGVHLKISRKYGKVRPLQIGIGVWAIALILALFINEASPAYLVYIVAALSAVGTSSGVLVPWSILPDISDVDELISGKRREGIYSGMATFLRKLANALALGIMGVLLQLIGYDGALVAQGAGTIMGIKYIFCLSPLVFMILSIFFCSKFNISESSFNILKEEVARLKAGGSKSEVDEQTKRVCEKLTGQKYDKLWGNN